MSKFRKLAVTIAALAALAVGGAAFAQAQNASTVAPATTQQSQGETSGPGDIDSVRGGDQNESERTDQADDQDAEGGDRAGAAQDVETND